MTNAEPEHRSSEAALQESVRRSWIRRASVLVVAGQGIAFLVGALLPTTPDPDRVGLLIGAGLVALSGIIWFALIPHEWFGRWRVFIACTIAQTVVLVVLLQTSGVASLYFPYYLLPSLVMVMTGDRRQTAILGALAFGGLVALALWGTHGGSQDQVRDLFAIHALQLVTFNGAAIAASRAVGGVVSTISERSHALSDQARTDALTGLGNRKLLDEELPRLIAAVDRGAGPLSVIALDLDGLKSVNDRQGHAAGDRVLVAFADVLRKSLRMNDRAMRAGGDEFVIVLPDTTQAAGAQVIERLRGYVAADLREWAISFSAGVATTTAAADPAWLLAVADDALYADKRRRSPQEVAR